MLQEPCEACGHSFSFHSKKPNTPCKASGCCGGPNGWTCVGFVAKADATPELIEALSTTS